MNTYRLTKRSAHELAAQLAQSVLNRARELATLAANPDYCGESFGPEALHLFTEASVLNRIGEIIDDSGAPHPLVIEDRESRDENGFAAEWRAYGFSIRFADHPTIGDAVRRLAARDAQTQAARLSELRYEAMMIARRVAELEGIGGAR